MARTQIVELPASAPRAAEDASPPFTKSAFQYAEIYVLFTTPDETLAALRIASELARPLNGEVTLVDFRVVPVGAPVEAPTGRSPIETGGFVERVRAEGIRLNANVYVCRDSRRAIPLVFKGHSLIVMGTRRHPWPTRAERWRRILERHGHFVLLVDTGNAEVRGAIAGEDNAAGSGAQTTEGPGDS